MLSQDPQNIPVEPVRLSTCKAQKDFCVSKRYPPEFKETQNYPYHWAIDPGPIKAKGDVTKHNLRA